VRLCSFSAVGAGDGGGGGRPGFLGRMQVVQMSDFGKLCSSARKQIKRESLRARFIRVFYD